MVDHGKGDGVGLVSSQMAGSDRAGEQSGADADAQAVKEGAPHGEGQDAERGSRADKRSTTVEQPVPPKAPAAAGREAGGKGKEKDDGDGDASHDEEGSEEDEDAEDDSERRDRDRHRHSELIKLGAAGAGKTGKIGVWGIYEPGRPLLMDPDHRSRIAARLLNAELTCPICLSIVRVTHTFMECMHRFCQECIEKYLRLGQKECPKCRVKVTSRRALRPDPAFDKLIQRFYPDIDAYEEKEEQFISRVNAESHSIAAAVEEGLRRQATAAGSSAGGRGPSATAAIAASTAANHAESRRLEAKRAEARKKEKGKDALSSAPSGAGGAASRGSWAPQNKAESGLSVSTLKRAAPQPAPAIPNPKRHLAAKRGAGPSAASAASAARAHASHHGGRNERSRFQGAGASGDAEHEGPFADEDDGNNDGASPPVTPPPPPAIMSEPNMVEFRLHPHPKANLKHLDKDYLCSLESCKMYILKKFLANRLKLDDWNSLDLLVNTAEQENAVIPNDLTLGTVVRMLWSRKGELKILFRLRS